MSDRILDAAEKVWSQEGYQAGSIRRIMAQAGLEFSLARYYFGRKEDLYRQVIERRAGALRARFELAFDSALKGAADGVPTIEAWIDALIQPSFDLLDGPDEGWRNYARLVADSAMLDQTQPHLAAMHEHLFPFLERFVDGLETIFPALDTEYRLWSIYFLQTSSISIFRNPRIMDHLTRGRVRTQDYARIRQVMASFFAAGFKRFASGDRPGVA